MTEYVKSTNFASKDTLPAGNALKIVKGTEINTEFDNIAVAVATKADLNSPNLLGTPVAPTPSYGDSTTKLATTAFVQAALLAIYPVGSIYSNASVGTNPATLLGLSSTTWAAIAGKVVIGLDTADATFQTAGSTGGSKDAIVPTHTHGATDSGHTHGYTNAVVGGGYLGGTSSFSITGSGTTASSTANITVSSTGVSATNANLQPYVVAYVWKRTA